MRTLRLFAILTVFGLVVSPAAAQRNFDSVTVAAQELTPKIHMLTGAGGNLAAVSGEDGIFLVDDQFAPLTDKIRAALAEISDQPIRFVINTHWHGDHTGGNENLGKAGTLIVAHDNVHQRMSTDQFMEAFDRTVPASPKAALPVITFDSTTTFRLNGEEIHAFHVPHAHTDGDSIIHFKTSDILHMGDTFFNGGYPFIDLGSGGSVDGLLAALERVLELAGPNTRIVPGHGPLASRDDLAAYHKMLKTSRDAVAALMKAGKTLDEVKAAKPTAATDEAWGGGFINPESFVTTLYTSLGDG